MYDGRRGEDPEQLVWSDRGGNNGSCGPFVGPHEAVTRTERYSFIILGRWWVSRHQAAAGGGGRRDPKAGTISGRPLLLITVGSNTGCFSQGSNMAESLARGRFSGANQTQFSSCSGFVSWCS